MKDRATVRHVYEAYDIKKNKIVKGSVIAVDEDSARGMLDESLKVIKIKADDSLPWYQEIKIPGLNNKGPNVKDMAASMRQMSTMLESGIPLIKTLSNVVDQCENKKLKIVWQQILQDVTNGVKLSDAMAEHPVIFDRVHIGLAEVGVNSGSLAEAISQIAKSLETSAKNKNEIKAAMAQPLAVLVIALLIAAAMVVIVVPKVAEMYASLGNGAKLPLPTLILIWVSERFLPIFAIMSILTWLVLQWSKKNKHKDWYRKRRDLIVSKIPGFGPLNVKFAQARFARNMSLMMKAGLTQIESLKITGESLGHFQMEEAVLNSREKVKNGKTLSYSLDLYPNLFPATLVAMLRAGEESGKVDEMLESAADNLENELEATMKQIKSLIDPLMMAVVGLVVGPIVIALYMPYLNLGNVIK